MERRDDDPLSEAPLLRSIPKDGQFAVPDGFFERFPHRVQEAVAAKRRPLWWAWLSPSAPMARVAWAAGVVLVAGVIWFTAPRTETDQPLTPSATALIDPDWAIADEDLFAELAVEADGVPGVQHELDADELAAYLIANDAVDYIAEFQ